MSTIEKISKNLNEPDFIRKMRLEALKEAGHLPRHELQYGLGIFAQTPNLWTSDVQNSFFEANPVKYGFIEAEGVQVLSWKDAQGLPLLEKHFTPERFPVLKNYYFASALAGFGSGLVIIAEEGVNATVSLDSVMEKSGADFIFVVAKKNSSLRILDTIRGENVLFARTMYVVAQDGASVEILSSQNLPHESSLFLNKFSAVERGGKVSWVDAHFGGGFVKSDIEDSLLGEGAESLIRNITLAGNQNFDFYNASHHKAPHTTSHISARGIAAGGGKIIYRGLVDIDENCPGSRGDQVGRFLLASSGAEIDAIPSLDIRSPEVTSSHAFSINHLKDSDFFYPALRGVEPYRAQAMLFEGFLSHDIINENILSLIRKKLSSQIYEISN
jgi:Fe-S cluster assembly scaffold protein SufB